MEAPRLLPLPMDILPLHERPIDGLLGILFMEQEILPFRVMETLLAREDEAFPHLLTLADDEEWRELANRTWETILLGLMGPRQDPEAAARALVRTLDDAVGSGPRTDDLWLAVAAAEALARIGEPAVRVIGERLPSASERYRVFAYGALGWIGTEAACQVLLDAAESDLALADVVAPALHEAGCADVLPTLHRLFTRCAPEHRYHVEDAILAHGHDWPRARSLDEDWRLRYRPSGPFPIFDPTWVGMAAVARDFLHEWTGELPVPPLRSLGEILADPLPEPDDPQELLCTVCEEPGTERLGLPACGKRHAAAVAELQRSLLEPWHDDGMEDLFDVLGEVDAELIHFRLEILGPLEDLADEPPSWSAGAEGAERLPTPATDEQLEDIGIWEVELRVVQDTCRWFLERGVRDVGTALARLRRASLAVDRKPRVHRPPPVPGVPVPRNAPCPCGSRLKYKRCCGRPGTEAALSAPLPEMVDAEGNPLAGDWLKHRADTVQDLFQAMAEQAAGGNGAPSGPADEIPLETRRNLNQRILDAHYRNWLDERIPALRSLTPREASYFVMGIRRLDELLATFEAAERRRRETEGFGYDFGWLRRELDI